MTESELISYGRRLTMLAEEHPTKTALIFVSESGSESFITWQELESQANRIARLLLEHGVGKSSLLVVGLPNIPEHIYVTVAGWKLGALVLPLRAALPPWERNRVLEVGQPTLIVADWDDVSFPCLKRGDLERARYYSDVPLPDCIPHPGRALASGGSTGYPKIIVEPRPWATLPGKNYFGYDTGYRPKQIQLVAGPLYHNSPFGWVHSGIFDDHRIILMEKFDAARVVDLIERHRVNFMFMSPTMMGRVARLPGVTGRDFSSIEALYHTSAPCPPWIKRFWIDVVGPDKLYEGYGSTEAIGAARIRGDDWLLHPGSVGRPYNTIARIVDAAGNELPPGEVGEIYMKRPNGLPTYYYIGSPPLQMTADGFSSVGDMGWLDQDGYLFIADRRADLIVTGGANVYPAEVEAALSEHPQVSDLVVIGVPDADWGRAVHAIIQLQNPASPPDVADLDRYCRQRLSSYKLPKSYEFVAELPRNQMGKIRRADLIAERETSGSAAFIRVPR